MMDRVNPTRGESVLRSLTWLGWRPFSRPAEALQTQQTKLLKLLHPEASVVVVAETLEFHAAQAPPNPGVQYPETTSTCEPPCGEEVSRTADDLVELHDNLRVQVVGAAGEFPHLVLKFPL